MDSQTGIRSASGTALMEFDVVSPQTVITAAAGLRDDRVLLFHSLDPEASQRLLSNLTEEFGLFNNLQLQAEFAPFHGHRKRIGKYFMTVTSRSAHQFITPHSEGSSKTNMQLAAFYCVMNTTDGGHSILFHLKEDCNCWPILREARRKYILPPHVRLTSLLERRAQSQYQLDLERDRLESDDIVLKTHQTTIPTLSIVDTLAKSRATYSVILGKQLCAFWSTIGNVDRTCAIDFARLLRNTGLLRQDTMRPEDLDTYADRRLWQSSVTLNEIFDSYLDVRLQEGDLLIHNNQSWAHAASNWSSDSGQREVAAAFA